MASDQKPNFPPGEESGGTMIGTGRWGAPEPTPTHEEPHAGGTMVGIGRVNVPAPTTPAPEAGATMVGIGRVNLPTPGAPPAPAIDGTMVGIPIPRIGAFGSTPNFGSMAMPIATAGQPSSPEPGGTLVGMARVGLPSTPPPAVPEAGATMVGIGRVNVPFGASTPPVPEAGGTMVGIGRVNVPAAFQSSHHDAAAPGGTMVGMARIGAPAATPSVPDAGSTMIGLAALRAPAGGGSFGAPVPDAGGTMVGLSPAAMQAPAVQSFAKPQRPSGPPPAYELISHIGGGELGQVFHARHRENGAEVALRIIRPEISAVPGAVEALRDVVAMSAAAQHTHLGKLYDLDETASPTLVMEYVQGKQLSKLMRERGAAPAPAVIDLGVRLCSALAAAHAAGLAHGRVHGGNVILEAKTGRWVMLDTAQGYAVQGLEPSHDLYALGALLYEMATAHSPFENGGDQAADPRTYVPTLPANLAALLMRALSPNPAVWFPSGIEFAQALGRARNSA